MNVLFNNDVSKLEEIRIGLVFNNLRFKMATGVPRCLRTIEYSDDECTKFFIKTSSMPGFFCRQTIVFQGWHNRSKNVVFVSFLCRKISANLPTTTVEFFIIKLRWRFTYFFLPRVLPKLKTFVSASHSLEHFMPRIVFWEISLPLSAIVNTFAPGWRLRVKFSSVFLQIYLYDSVIGCEISSEI